MSDVSFLVDPRLTALLSATYRSTESAIKELVDNAWDADATQVHISLPPIMTPNPVIKVRDNGSGMTLNEVKSDYLTIAKSRVLTRGEKTPKLSRRVKGRKGIGKFAGFVVADEMQIETSANGTSVSFTVVRSALEKSEDDLERVRIPLLVTDDANEKHGTLITLRKLIQTRSFPKEDRLKEILVVEYGREAEFRIFINDSPIGIEDIPGETHEHRQELDPSYSFHLTFKIAEPKTPVKNPGICYRVNGKIVGKPTFLGMENDERIPPKLLNRVYGEVEADCLAEDVTADWGAILENSVAYQRISTEAAQKVTEELRNRYFREFNLQKARLQKQINDRIQTLPQYKREFAQKEIEKVIAKFYGETDEKIEVITNVVLDAIEKDEYYWVLDQLDRSKSYEVQLLASVLDQFGLFNTALIMRQFNVRESFLDHFDDLIRRPKTREADAHRAIENNLWILGHHYHLISSNKTLRALVEQYLDRNFHDKDRANKRPDLLLAEQYDNEVLLIEFKRPSKTITRDDENQAEKYRDDLIPDLGTRKIRILVIGGKIDERIKSVYNSKEVNLTTYSDILSKSRAEIQWLLEELKSP